MTISDVESLLKILGMLAAGIVTVYSAVSMISGLSRAVKALADQVGMLSATITRLTDKIEKHDDRIRDLEWKTGLRNGEKRRDGDTRGN